MYTSLRTRWLDFLSKLCYLTCKELKENKMFIDVGTITAKGQTTIPALLRKQLGLNSGDKIIFEKENDKITIKKLKKGDKTYMKFISESFSEEWDSKEDNEAYNDL